MATKAMQRLQAFKPCPTCESSRKCAMRGVCQEPKPVPVKRGPGRPRKPKPVEVSNETL